MSISIPASTNMQKVTVEQPESNLTHGPIRLLLSKKGMTLIEIMIVLTIISGVIGILVPIVMERRKKAAVSQTKLIMNSVISSIGLYQNDCNKLPKSLENLVTAPPECTNWGPDPYVKKIPKDSWGNELVYEVDGSKFTLKSLGADGKEGGDKYDRDITQEDLE